MPKESLVSPRFITASRLRWASRVSSRKKVTDKPGSTVRLALLALGLQHGVEQAARYHSLKLNQWQCQQRPQGHRPRVEGWVSRCYDRAIVGWRLARSGIANVAAAALEGALRRRQIDLTTPGLVLRSDNGLVFGAKASVKAARRHGLPQESITPYTPQQNGMIARFFLTLKQERVWLHRFESRDHAFRVVADWLDKYDAERPHSALGYLTLTEYRETIAA